MYFASLVAILAICCGLFYTVDTNILKRDCDITDFSQVPDVVSRCTNIRVWKMDVPAGETLNLKLQTGTTLYFKDIVKFGVANWDGPLVNIEGNDLRIYGAAGIGFSGQGEEYWDGKGSQGSKKPLFLKINVQGGEFYVLNFVNCPERCTSITGSDILINGWTINTSDGDKDNLGVDTVGFEVSGDNITIRNSLVFNQDDCIRVERGSNMLISNNYCNGGNGLNVEVGADPEAYEENVVSNITFDYGVIENSTYGIHVKTVKGSGPGLLQNISFSSINMIGIKNYSIRIHQDYPADDNKPEGNVPIRVLNLKYVTGNMSGSSAVPVDVVCASGACSDWTWSNISIKGNSTPCSMNYEPSGFFC
ncbi:polygalacturonase [Leptinotarsa decemlineata]|uniref:polygalacturonase n=1 Tax=Leptinotarsa decemlineata TaxID=7539 RepID=UPI000C2534E7|nr:polygalacturonase-like [Leptinotarsa decemlineata]